MAKHISFSVLLILLLSLASCSSNAQNAGSKGFAVVELFTSEGCSSCPAADAVLADLKKDYEGSVFVLGFHVDYWNRLGWSDVYSNSDYSKRQSAYASAMKLESVYTPQAIVNGSHELVGSDRAKLYSLTKDALKTSANAAIKLSAKQAPGNKILITCQLQNIKNADIHFALVQSGATSDVKKGENKGRQLHHVNIVRNFITIKAGNSNSEISIDTKPLTRCFC